MKFKKKIILFFLSGLALFLFINRNEIGLYRKITEAKEKILNYDSVKNSAIYFLKKHIEKKDPKISNNSISKMEKIDLLREWVHENILFSSQDKRTSLDSGGFFDFYRKEGPEIIQAFEESLGGVVCGGSAHILKKLYEFYGFQAYTLDNGVSGVYTHVITLVKVFDKGRDAFYVQDPYYNFSYVDLFGNPLDFFELLEFLNKHKEEKIKVKMGKKNTISRIYIKEGHGPIIKRENLSYETLKNSFSKAWRQLSKIKNINDNPAYIYKFPVSIFGHESVEKELLKKVVLAISK
ncbi:hypothetical protein HN511_00455 [bacterium]|jgi:hypothetical protein|nr:hypothetical protein [bacterium]